LARTGLRAGIIPDLWSLLILSRRRQLTPAKRIAEYLFGHTFIITETGKECVDDWPLERHCGERTAEATYPCEVMRIYESAGR